MEQGSFLPQKKFSVSRAAFIIGMAWFLSKVIGQLRDSLLAAKIGPGPELDTYYAAFRLPDFVFNLLILGTLSVAFIPAFTELLSSNKQKALKVANSVMNLTAAGMALLCVILYFLAKPLTKIIAPGFSDQQLLAAINLTRLFLFSPVIFSVSNVFSGILNAHKRFLVVGLAPILYNLGIIFGLFVMYPRWGIFGLGLGVILGAILHLLTQAIEAFFIGYRWQPVADLNDPVIKKIIKLFLPRIMGMDNSQISLLIGTSVGSILATGSVTIFNFANNLQAAPLGIFAISMSTAAFPLLSEQAAKGDNTAFVETLAKSVMRILYFIVPVSILMIIFRAYIVRLLLGHGNFDWADTIMTFTTLGILSLSLLSQSLTPLFSRVFYARQNTIIPVTVNLIAIALNALLAFVLGKHYGLPGVAAGFVAASSLDCFLMFLLLRVDLARQKISLAIFDTQLGEFLFKLLFSGAVLGMVSRGTIFMLAPLVNTHTTAGILIQAGGSALLGILAFAWVSYKLEIPQTKTSLDFLKRLL